MKNNLYFHSWESPDEIREVLSSESKQFYTWHAIEVTINWPTWVLRHQGIEGREKNDECEVSRPSLIEIMIIYCKMVCNGCLQNIKDSKALDLDCLEDIPLIKSKTMWYTLVNGNPNINLVIVFYNPNWSTEY